jgi:hypothetical protein
VDVVRLNLNYPVVMYELAEGGLELASVWTGLGVLELAAVDVYCVALPSYGEWPVTRCQARIGLGAVERRLELVSEGLEPPPVNRQRCFAYTFLICAAR